MAGTSTAAADGSEGADAAGTDAAAAADGVGAGGSGTGMLAPAPQAPRRGGITVRHKAQPPKPPELPPDDSMLRPLVRDPGERGKVCGRECVWW